MWRPRWWPPSRARRQVATNPLALPSELFALRSPCPSSNGGVDFFSSDWADMQLPERHRFPIEKYGMVRDVLQGEGFARVLLGPLATVDEACLAHDRAYVESIVTGQVSVSMRKRVGFAEAPIESYVLRTFASLGATVAATRRCLRDGIWSGAVSGGTHHAFRDAGEGFCVFNDIAVAARLAQSEFGVRSVLVVDLDVHQGNGTAGIFKGESSGVYTVSVHQAKGYPFSTRCASDLDISLPDGIGDEEYLQHLFPLQELIKRLRPGLLLYQAGVDGLQRDRFGRFALTRRGLARRNEMLYRWAAESGVPVVVTMGGGYHKDISQTVQCSADVYRQAAHFWQFSDVIAQGEPLPEPVSLPKARDV